MKRRKNLFIITCVFLLLTSFVVQASMPVPDLLPFGQLKLDRDETEEASQEEASQEEEQISGNSAAESVSENDAETAQDVLDGDAIGSSVILISDKTAEDYELAYERAKNANWGYTNLGIADVSDNLNIRAVAAEDGRLVGKLPRNAACEVIDTDDTWAHIKSGSVEGYVSLEYLLTGVPAKFKAEELAVTVAKVATDSLKVRAEANTESEVITLVAMGEELEVAAVEGDWVKVLLDNDEVYVSAEYVEVSAELSTAVTMTELLYGQGVSDVRVDICQYAKEFIGNPYVWGGTSLTKGGGLLRLCDEGIPEVRRETSPEFQIAGKLRHHDQGGGGEAGRPDLLREGQNHQPCGDLYRKRAGGPRQQSKDGNQDFQRILPHAVQGGAGTVRLR